MASIFGESGTWKQLRFDLNNLGFYPHQSSDIPYLKDTIKNELDSIRANAEKNFYAQAALLNNEIELIQKQIEETHSLFFSYLRTTIRQEQQRHSKSILLVKRSSFTTRRMKRVLFFIKYYKVISKHKRYKRLLNGQIMRSQNEKQYHFSNREKLLSDMVGVDGLRLNKALEIVTSPVVYGGIAEDTVLEKLKNGLSADFFVYPDITLNYPISIFFDGNYLKSAQIDFLVLGPTGVYVLEVKNWSRKFTESHKYFDPFEQVSRAGYLCYRLLDDSDLKTKVRQVIVTNSKLPNPQNRNFVATVSPDSIVPYIRTQSIKMDKPTIEKIHQYFLRRIPMAV